MTCKKRAIAILSIFIALLLFSTTVDAEQKQKLPRSHGPLYLGMSVEEFKNITSVEPQGCVGCNENEEQADLYVSDEMAKQYSFNIRKTLEPIKLKNAYIQYQSKNLQPDLIICRFYKGKLYSIALIDVKSILKAVEDRYIKVFGTRPKVDVWNSGLSQVRWETQTTLLRVVYHTKEKGIDTIEISYVDVKTMSKMPKKSLELKKN